MICLPQDLFCFRATHSSLDASQTYIPKEVQNLEFGACASLTADVVITPETVSPTFKGTCKPKVVWDRRIN
jgi:hypothetical protein